MTEGYGYEPRRVVLCTCGWSGRFTTLRSANLAMKQHEQEGTEGCDHAFDIEERP